MTKKEEKKKEVAESTEFNVAMFEAQQYTQRIESVSVPGLAAYYPKDVKPVIKVRNLDCTELAVIDIEVGYNREAREEIIGLANEDITKALKTIFHFVKGDDVPDAHVRALNIVSKGIVEPAMPFAQVVKLAKVHPVEFKILFNTITQLTGLGALPEKLNASGKTKK